MSEWIPVTDRLPEVGVEVLLIDKNNRQLVGYNKKVFTFIDQSGEVKHIVSDDIWHVGEGIKTYDDVWLDEPPIAWMPLPPPPTSEGKDE